MEIILIRQTSLYKIFFCKLFYFYYHLVFALWVANGSQLYAGRDFNH